MAFHQLEDEIGDVLKKAQKGLNLGPRSLASQTGLTREELEAAARGEAPDEHYRILANQLHLDYPALRGVARRTYLPRPIAPIEGFWGHTSGYKDFTVNAYLLADSASGEAAIFDTGTNVSPLLDIVARENLRLTQVFLTHTHRDHVMDLDKLRHRSAPAIWTGQEETWPNARSFSEGRTFSVGGLRIQTLSTKGHARGGITYLVEGWSSPPVAVVGDAVFAGSIGGPLISFRDAKRTIIESLFPLPDETILAPGHGPLTTLGEEKKNNPFLAAWANEVILGRCPRLS